MNHQMLAAEVLYSPEKEAEAVRLLREEIKSEVGFSDIKSYLNAASHILNNRTKSRLESEQTRLDTILSQTKIDFKYAGLATLKDRYLLKDKQQKLIETPEMMFIRVALALTETLQEFDSLFSVMSQLKMLQSTPTLLNAGTNREQLSSCYLLNPPADSINGIYDSYKDIANLSKHAGGIGIPFSSVRADGSLIESTNGISNGVVPFLKTLDSSVAAVNQGGRRKGACCVYLETWHADIEDFLELRENTGDIMRRTYNLNIANWVPDLFMRRVENDEEWSLFCPTVGNRLKDLHNKEFDIEYETLEKAGLAKKVVRARDLYTKMMRTLGETGNGWMNFKDAANGAGMQVYNRNIIHSSNLCTEILEVTDSHETAVCNLASINLSKCVDSMGDLSELSDVVRVAVRGLDAVIDINLYPISSSKASNSVWRPIGLGVMGFQDLLFKLRVPFESQEAVDIARKISEVIYFTALDESCNLAQEKGSFLKLSESQYDNGMLHTDFFGVESPDWLRDKVNIHGVRNSLLIAIAPTATISTIAGCYECIEPQSSNVFKRETLSGEFIVLNSYLVDDLKSRGLFSRDVINQIVENSGSIQSVDAIPDEMKALYKTSWEVSNKALIDLAAARMPYIDQSQSLNLFMESPTIEALSSMYMYAWKKGLKTTYYLRSRPAKEIRKNISKEVYCSLENPESCESCQ